MSIKTDFVKQSDEQAEDLSVAQLEDITGGFWPAVAATVTGYAVWEGINFVARAGSSAGRRDR